MPTLFFGALLLAACNLGGNVTLRDGGTDTVDAAVDGDGDPDADDGPDADDEGGSGLVLTGPGPLTFVATSIEIVSERICDVNDDGIADNAIADLGEPAATLMGTTLTSMLAMAINRGNRWLVHFPWVEDRTTLTDSEAPLLTFIGRDEETCVPGHTDEDRNPEDDFSGEEPFCAKLADLDGCGEPMSPPGSATLEGGSLSADTDRFTFGDDPAISIRRATVEGTIAPSGSSIRLDFCGYAVASELGAEELTFIEGDMSLLEGFLAGGVVFGVPTLPGLLLDVDVDGDGLERFEMDGEHRIERCIDGDDSVIEGRDCWGDDRIADGLSLAFRATAVSAIFTGREPGWDVRSCSEILTVLDLCPRDECMRNATGDVCPENREVFSALGECEVDSCSADCAPPDRANCRRCLEASCSEELAACLEAEPCCPTPPEVSAWDLI